MTKFSRLMLPGVAVVALAGCLSTGFGLLVDKHMVPTLEAIASEHCFAAEVVGRDIWSGDELPFAGEAAKMITGLLSGARQVVLSVASQDEANQMFCQQNLIAAVASTEEAMKRMLTETGSGTVLVAQALNVKSDEINDLVFQLKRKSGDSLSSDFHGSVNPIVEKLKELSPELTAAIEKQLESGGLSEDSRKKLADGAQHLRNASYYRGKGIVGAVVIADEFESGRAQQTAREHLSNSEAKKLLGSAKSITISFFSLLQGFGESLALTNSIYKLGDGDELEERLKAQKNPSPDDPDSIEQFAAFQQQSTSGLGLENLSGKPTS